MKVAVLCPGKSIETFKPDGYDKVIGVNRAVAFSACDFWMCLDDPKQVVATLEGGPGAVKGRPVVDQWPKQLKALEARCDHQIEWRKHSSIAAIGVAVLKGATEIDVYGMDWSGDQDWTGKRYGSRDENRWNDERALYGEIAKRLDEWGIKLTRVGASETSSRFVSGPVAEPVSEKPKARIRRRHRGKPSGDGD